MKRPVTASKKKNATASRWRWARRVGWTLVGLFALLVILDFSASPVARSIANRKLAGVPNYTGHLDRVKISVFRTHCEIDGFVFKKRDDDGPPLAQFKQGMLKLDFVALLTGHLRGSVVIQGLQIICVKTARTDTTKDVRLAMPAISPTNEWEEAFKQKCPIELTSIELKDSQICFLDRSRSPAAEIMLEQLNVVATGLLSKPTADTEMPATLIATALTPGHGRLNLRIQADPGADSPRFYVQFALKDLSLPEINPLLLNYGKVEVAKGTLGFQTEITACRGVFTGFVKPELKDLDYKIANLDHTNSVQILSRRVFAALRSIFYQKDDSEVPSKLPISGTIEPAHAQLWPTVVSVMRKALSQGFRERFREETPSNA